MKKLRQHYGKHCAVLNGYRWFVSLILGLIFLALPMYSKAPSFHSPFEELTHLLVSAFHVRMSEFSTSKQELHDIPPIIFSEKVTANAIWHNDTIRLGQSLFTQKFFCKEDRLSILYHEYQHYRNELSNRFPCQKDLSGGIVQIETDIIFTRELSHSEIDQDYTALVTENMSEKEKMLLWESLSLPNLMRFRYAPSNLAREEIFCYRSEVQANKAGMFKHSTEYAEYLHYRIKREQSYLKMRIEFEKKNKLRSDGSPIAFSKHKEQPCPIIASKND